MLAYEKKLGVGNSKIESRTASKMQITASRGRVGVCVLGVAGMILLTAGSLCLGFFESIVKIILKKELMLVEGNEFFKIWRDLPIPIFQRIYVFNITNPEEFEKYGSKPILKEIGPYTFRGDWRKHNVSWNEADGTVSYKDLKKYTFVPELSVGTQEEMIYTLNGPLLAVINNVEELAPFFLRPFIVSIMNGVFESYNETLLVHKTVREMIYDGYHEPMVADLTKMIEPFINLPLKLINDTFAVFHERKQLGDGEFTILSGVNGFDKFAEIQKWDNKSTVDWWQDKYCNQINGTDGIQYSPGIKRNDTLQFFIPHLCRTMNIRYERDTTVHGIGTYRFAFPADELASPVINPKNKCYCAGHKCYVSGILPLNTCKKGAPYVASWPHFFDADPELQTSLVGVSPTAEKHKSFIDVDPITGIALNAALRFQLNGVVKRMPEYTPLKYVGESIVPVLWCSEEARVSVYLANYFKSKVNTPLAVGKAFSITGIALGGLWVMSAAVFVTCMIGKVKHPMKTSYVMNTLQHVYTSVALWPPTEDEIKEPNQTTRMCL